MNTQNNIIEKDREAEDSKKTIESTVIKLLRTQGKVDVFSFFFFLHSLIVNKTFKYIFQNIL